jgi:ATP-dependent Clp protease ATP-binding subunit ClpA
MLERFTDRARRVVVLAEEEARMLGHNWIGTEHLLLGVLREGDGVAARALESLGISLQPVRQQVEEIIGPVQQVPVQQVPAEHIPFTPRSKKVLELSLRESLQLGHDRVGTGHILLGLIREGDGVAARVLIRLGADLNQVRQQVIELVSDLRPQSGRPLQSGRRPPREVAPVIWMHTRLDVFGGRLAAVEQQVGIGPDTSDLDEQIAQVRREKESAVDARDYEQAAALGNREKELLAGKAARREEWAAGHPALPVLAERVQQLADETERLRALLRQHGIDPHDKPA